MDTTPPSHRSNPSSQAKSASRLSRITYSIDPESQPPQLSLDLIPSSPKENPSTPSSLSLKSSTSFLPLRELLLLSPSPSRKSRTRLADRDEMTEEGGCEQNGSRRRCKSRGSQTGSIGCASPRSNRRENKCILFCIVKMNPERNARYGTGAFRPEFGRKIRIWPGF